MSKSCFLRDCVLCFACADNCRRMLVDACQQDVFLLGVRRRDDAQQRWRGDGVDGAAAPSSEASAASRPAAPSPRDVFVWPTNLPFGKAWNITGTAETKDEMVTHYCNKLRLDKAIITNTSVHLVPNRLSDAKVRSGEHFAVICACVVCKSVQSLIKLCGPNLMRHSRPGARGWGISL